LPRQPGSRIILQGAGMFARSYRKRLEQDLIAWTGAGLIAPEQAQAIRRASAAQIGGTKITAALGMMGALLLASSVIAFVAANWHGVPRLVKLAGILIAIVVALGFAVRFVRHGSPRASDAASTAATLIFGAGVALVGQMYHLPADWPAGALLVGLGALFVAALMRSDGALLVAFIAAGAWLYGVFQESGGSLTPFYPLFWLAATALAAGRTQRAVHHAAVLGLILWLALALNDWWIGRQMAAHIAYGLGLSIVFISLGALAVDRAGPRIMTALLPWGLLGYVCALSLQLFRILERVGLQSGSANLPTVIAGLLACAALAAFWRFAADRRSAALLAGSLAAGAAITLTFWSGVGVTMAGRAFAAALILLSATLMVAAGASSGVRRILLAGVAAFGISVFVLLHRTVGTLLDQSLFFFVGGVALIAVAMGARRLLARFSPAEGGR
jgi:uncharacterized membrane protein